MASIDNGEHRCVVNIGHFRSGTTTLAEAAQSLGAKACRTYQKLPSLSQDQFKALLQNPSQEVTSWFKNGGKLEILDITKNNQLVCDGYLALLPFLGVKTLRSLQDEALKRNISLEFVATHRTIESTVQTELQHWIVWDLERKGGLDSREHAELENCLRKRAQEHDRIVQELNSYGFLKILELTDHIEDEWPAVLAEVSPFKQKEWQDALTNASKRNANPPLPVEGILLTLRLGLGQQAKANIAAIDRLIGQVELDLLCRYVFVVALDEDEAHGREADDLIKTLYALKNREGSQLVSFRVLTNSPRKQSDPFPACRVWDSMAVAAREQGADWVVFLGHDVTITCSYHYRAIYRSFLDISQRLNVPFGFGCPWWNDTEFPGFPSFPCVGKIHFEIFGRLIPPHRAASFVNQDLDPYLHRLYSKFHASPCVIEATLSNKIGGNISAAAARYERVPCYKWQDFSSQDIEPIRAYLPYGTSEAILVDVVVPSYRVRLDYLESISSLRVPDYMKSTFIIIIDNPEELIRKATMIASNVEGECMTLEKSERVLEEYLSRSGNIVRVRCNKINIGASASRNRGLDESAAEFILNLDDDLIPDEDLLLRYGERLLDIDDTTIGLIGLVRFPRQPRLPLKHAAVLMSYLTFMFEIAETKLYDHPAWGVTANILFRRSSVRFDLAYAKTGGGEDVDFSLNMAAHFNGGKLVKVPEARVTHPFWSGSIITLASHFFNWAIGDGSLFPRFPERCYWSFPNVPEMTLLVAPLGIWNPGFFLFKLFLTFLAADLFVDIIVGDFKHRCDQLRTGTNSAVRRSTLFYLTSHMLANIYIVVLEYGRLWGHLSRCDLVHGFCRRFDWHCGRLPMAPHDFRRREALKFLLFSVAILFGCSGGGGVLYNLAKCFWEIFNN